MVDRGCGHRSAGHSGRARGLPAGGPRGGNHGAGSGGARAHAGSGGKGVIPAPALSEAATALCGALILLIPFALAGLALMNAGLGRSRSAAHSLMAALAVTAVAALAYWFCGFAWQGLAGLPAYAFSLGEKPWSWIGAQPFFLRGLDFDGSPAGLAAGFGIFAAALAAMIPL